MENSNNVQVSVDFRVGDLARLKGGSPALTIQEIDKGSVTCVWFDGNKLGKANFPLRMLQLTDTHE
jgi:uncharacterized protein YodC (DUF2158 family)